MTTSSPSIFPAAMKIVALFQFPARIFKAVSIFFGSLNFSGSSVMLLSPIHPNSAIVYRSVPSVQWRMMTMIDSNYGQQTLYEDHLIMSYLYRGIGYII